LQLFPSKNILQNKTGHTPQGLLTGCFACMQQDKQPLSNLPFQAGVTGNFKVLLHKPHRSSVMETVILASFDNYFSANIMLSRMQQAGIPCFLKDEYTVTIDPILSNAIGGIKLAVPERYAAEAIAMLKQFEEAYLQSVICPQCGSNRISQVSKQGATNFITAILTWLFSSYAVAPEKIYQCQDCGYETENLPENKQEYN